MNARRVNTILNGYPQAMTIIYILLLIAALGCFVLACTRLAARVNLIALGLAFWVAVPLIQHLRALN